MEGKGGRFRVKQDHIVVADPVFYRRFIAGKPADAPYDFPLEAGIAENFIHHHADIGRAVRIELHIDGARIRQQLARQQKPFIQELQIRVGGHSVVVTADRGAARRPVAAQADGLGISGAAVVRRIDIDQVYGAAVIAQQVPQHRMVVP